MLQCCVTSCSVRRGRGSSVAPTKQDPVSAHVPLDLLHNLSRPNLHPVYCLDNLNTFFSSTKKPVRFNTKRECVLWQIPGSFPQPSKPSTCGLVSGRPAFLHNPWDPGYLLDDCLGFLPKQTYLLPLESLSIERARATHRGKYGCLSRKGETPLAERISNEYVTYLETWVSRLTSCFCNEHMDFRFRHAIRG